MTASRMPWHKPERAQNREAKDDPSKGYPGVLSQKATAFILVAASLCLG